MREKGCCLCFLFSFPPDERRAGSNKATFPPVRFLQLACDLCGIQQCREPHSLNSQRPSLITHLGGCYSVVPGLRCLSAFPVSCRCCGNHTTPLLLFLLFPPPPMFIKNHKMYKIIKVIKNGFLRMTALIQSKSLWRKNSFSFLEIKVLMLPLPLAHPQTGVCACTTCLHTSECLIVYRKHFRKTAAFNQQLQTRTTNWGMKFLLESCFALGPGSLQAGEVLYAAAK